MDTSMTPQPAPAAATPKRQLTRARVRNRKKQAFLAAIALHGTVMEAAQASGVNRATHYKWFDADPDYAQAFEEAREAFRDVVRAEVRRRAVDGWDEPVTIAGAREIVRKRSDRMLELLAKAMCPEFRDRHEITGEGGGPVKMLVVRYPEKSPDAASWAERWKHRAKALDEPPADE
jgi:hypothetical protein